MATFLEMQQSIEGQLNRTDLTDYVKRAINRSIAKYSKQRWWFDETEATFSTVQGLWSYDDTFIPDNIRQIDYHRITVNNVYYNVIERDIQFIVDANVNNNQGQPTDYAWYEKKIFYYPIPQDAYPITLYYQKIFAPLVNPTDTNDFTEIEEAQDLIEAEAMRWMYARVIIDVVLAAQFKVEAKDAWQALNEINESMTGINGYITPTDW